MITTVPPQTGYTARLATEEAPTKKAAPRGTAQDGSREGKGAAEKPPASNGAFRGGKGSLYEGALRVPAFVHFPARLAPAVVNEPLHHVDVMPTLLALAGAQAKPAKPLDGQDMWPTLAEGRPSPHDVLPLHIEQLRAAVRQGKWKLILTVLLPGKVELYDLEADPGESKNVAAEHPDVAKALEARLREIARTQQMSRFLLTQSDFFGVQGETQLAPELDEDAGSSGEKPVLPEGR